MLTLKSRVLPTAVVATAALAVGFPATGYAAESTTQPATSPNDESGRTWVAWSDSVPFEQALLEEVGGMPDLGPALLDDLAAIRARIASGESVKWPQDVPGASLDHHLATLADAVGQEIQTPGSGRRSMGYSTDPTLFKTPVRGTPASADVTSTPRLSTTRLVTTAANRETVVGRAINNNKTWSVNTTDDIRLIGGYCDVSGCFTTDEVRLQMTVDPGAVTSKFTGNIYRTMGSRFSNIHVDTFALCYYSYECNGPIPSADMDDGTIKTWYNSTPSPMNGYSLGHSFDFWGYFPPISQYIASRGRTGQADCRTAPDNTCVYR